MNGKIRSLHNPPLSSWINLIALSGLAVVFSLLFPSAKECAGFIAYFLMLSLGGWGLLLLLRGFTKNAVIDIINSFIVGASTNFLLFTLLRFTGTDANWSVALVFLAGLLSVLLHCSRGDEVFPRLSLSDPMLGIVAILAILAIFLVSDNLYYLKDGISVHDRVHPTYELSISASLDSMFPVYDLSYEGKVLKYHFGSPILLYQLINIFGLDSLPLSYVILPVFLVLLALFYLCELSKALKKNAYRLLFIAAVFFSTMSIDTEFLIWVKAIARMLIPGAGPVMAPSVIGPIMLFSSMMVMGSYALASLMVLSLFSFVRMKQRNYAAECIVLTGIAFSKSTFFLPLVIAYISYAVLIYVLSKDLHKALKNAAVLLPGLLYIIVLVMGAHKQDLWVVFPGSVNIDAQFPKGDLLLTLINLPVSGITALLIYVGLGFFYLVPESRRILNQIGSQREKIIEDPSTLCLLIIFCSYGMGMLLCEVSEGDHTQFLFPGYIFLSILTCEYLLRKHAKNRVFIALFTALLLFNTATDICTRYVIPSINTADPGDLHANSAIANAKQQLIKTIPSTGAWASLKMHVTPKCLYSYDLINGLASLSEEKNNRVFVYDKMHEFCENDNKSRMFSGSGYIMTAVSRKQTVLENYKYKGVLAEPDYCNRTFENVVFFHEITGKGSEIKNISSEFFGLDMPKYEDLSYYGYLRLFSAKNFYTYNQDFRECINAKIAEYKSADSDKIDVLRSYLERYNVGYVLFDEGEIPLGTYASRLGMKMLYESGKVSVYRVNNKTAS